MVSRTPSLRGRAGSGSSVPGTEPYLGRTYVGKRGGNRGGGGTNRVRFPQRVPGVLGCEECDG
jgi:hypothetical protein